jgi:hypothetical protein
MPRTRSGIGRGLGPRTDSFPLDSGLNSAFLNGGLTFRGGKKVQIRGENCSYSTDDFVKCVDLILDLFYPFPLSSSSRNPTGPDPPSQPCDSRRQGREISRRTPSGFYVNDSLSCFCRSSILDNHTSEPFSTCNFFRLVEPAFSYSGFTPVVYDDSRRSRRIGSGHHLRKKAAQLAMDTLSFW